jgi:HJR/Mrr/RecB family endonuclease
MQTKLQAAESSVLLDKMSGFEFEELVAQVLTKLGLWACGEGIVYQR